MAPKNIKNQKGIWWQTHWVFHGGRVVDTNQTNNQLAYQLPEQAASGVEPFNSSRLTATAVVIW